MKWREDSGRDGDDGGGDGNYFSYYWVTQICQKYNLQNNQEIEMK